MPLFCSSVSNQCFCWVMVSLLFLWSNSIIMRTLLCRIIQVFGVSLIRMSDIIKELNQILQNDIFPQTLFTIGHVIPHTKINVSIVLQTQGTLPTAYSTSTCRCLSSIYCGELGSWWSNEGTIETPPLLNYQRSNEDWWWPSGLKITPCLYFWASKASSLATAGAGQGHGNILGMAQCRGPLSWLTDIYAAIPPCFISVAGKILLA